MRRNRVLASVLTTALVLGGINGSLCMGARDAEASSYGTEYLTGVNLDLYNMLKSSVSDIASGDSSSAVIEIGVSYTFSELGVDNVNDAASVVSEMLDTTSVVNYLMYDCPYELYWMDKTQSVDVDVDGLASGDTISIEVVFSFHVSDDYQGESETELDADKVAYANTVIENAQDIVDAYKDATDAEMLEAYKEEICALVSYEKDYEDVSYGNLWQLIWVFDGDDSTNVVCEGYAKAFQYLCDLTEFEGDVECYTVTGTTSNGLGAGSHMWNLVRIDGATYLVDVTNSESGAMGQDGDLFLACANDTDDSSSTGYTFTINGQTLEYAYDTVTLGLYSEDVLTLVTEEEEPEETETETEVEAESEETETETEAEETESGESTDTGYLLGDVNNDGDITYLDAMMVLRYDAVLIDLDETQLLAGDVNKDGEVNSLDAIKILRYDAGLITSF